MRKHASSVCASLSPAPGTSGLAKADSSLLMSSAVPPAALLVGNCSGVTSGAEAAVDPIVAPADGALSFWRNKALGRYTGLYMVDNLQQLTRM